MGIDASIIILKITITNLLKYNFIDFFKSKNKIFTLSIVTLYLDSILRFILIVYSSN